MTAFRAYAASVYLKGRGELTWDDYFFFSRYFRQQELSQGSDHAQPMIGWGVDRKYFPRVDELEQNAQADPLPGVTFKAMPSAPSAKLPPPQLPQPPPGLEPPPPPEPTDPRNEKAYGNRCAANTALKRFAEALNDADYGISINPE